MLRVIVIFVDRGGRGVFGGSVCVCWRGMGESDIGREGETPIPLILIFLNFMALFFKKQQWGYSCLNLEISDHVSGNVKRKKSPKFVTRNFT